MAGSIIFGVFGVAESLIGKLASRAFEEASRVVGVYDDLREIQNTLSLVKAVLLDAEQKQEHNHELHVWLRQLKLVFSDAENVLDEVECEALRRHVVNAHGSTKRKVCRFFSSSNPLVFRYKLAGQIKDVKRRLDKVAADRSKFGLEMNTVDKRVVNRREMTHSHIIAKDVKGREHDKENIIKLLMIPQHSVVDDQNLSVIPIVGIGGLGKTTLAKLVFNDKRIDESFALKMWVCVSDDFTLKQLIIKILNSASMITSPPIPTHQRNFKNLDVEQLQTHLRNILTDQKFLLVLDDVWNYDPVKWVELRNLIQVGAQGSKLLVTTRSHSIASMMGTFSSYTLQGLSQDDSMSLFVKWAFKEGEENSYPALVAIGQEIAKKCAGLPLAVRTLGSSLFSKVDIEDWTSVRDNEVWNIEQKEDDILPALKLSYDQMRSYLRQCFAFFSLFPKDFDLNTVNVGILWGAHGLLPTANKDKTFEDVTNQYLNELLSRSFLLDFVDFGGLYNFTIHDLVHDLALYVTKDEFLLVNMHSQSISENFQHLSFVKDDLLPQSSIPKGVRTIIFPVVGVGANSEFFLKTRLSSCKYLRSLDLSDSEYENLPRSIGKLKHLRLLKLKRNKITRLPNSVCKLQNLQVLSLDGCMELKTLPKGLKNLISLQVLGITTKQSVLPENDIANLTSLQNLTIDGCDNLESLLFEGIQLPTLKRLFLTNCDSLKFLWLDAKHFPELDALSVTGCDKLELSKACDEKNPNLRLKILYLGSLPQLVTLPQWLQGSTNTLQSLIIIDCENLEVLPKWLSTLSCLKVLWIHDCPKLLSLPNDIDRLISLEHLQIKYCPELSKKFQPQIGEYWPKISHVKHIDIDELEQFDKEKKNSREGKMRRLWKG